MQSESAKRQERRRIKRLREEIFGSNSKDIETVLDTVESFQADSVDSDEIDSVATEDEEDIIFGCLSESETDGNPNENPDEFVQCSLVSNLASWVNKYRPSREATNDLLKILASNGLDLPRDCRTLLKTPRHVDTIEKCGGTYFYNGIEKGVIVAPNNLKDKDITKIELSMNIDGVLLARSSNSQLWPILGSINNSDFVFIIVMFHGSTKPTSLNDYLADFICEAKKLIENGVYHPNGITYPFEIKCFICDCPARAFLKCVIGHNGFHGCERCEIEGTRIQHRTVFNAATYKEKCRTEAEFDSGSYLGDHQKSLSPLIDLGINCISQFHLTISTLYSLEF